MARKKTWLEKKFKRKSDRYMFINICFVVAFTVTMIIVFCFKGAVPDPLVEFVKYFCCFESGCLAYIKGSNNKHGGST